MSARELVLKLQRLVEITCPSRSTCIYIKILFGKQ